MPKIIFPFLIALILLACDGQTSQSKSNQDSLKNTSTKSSNLATNRDITSAEKPLVGKWSTVFRDLKGNLVLPKQTEGSYLNLKDNGSYQLLVKEKILRQGAWKYDPEEKTLELKTKINTTHFRIDSIQTDLLDMTDQKRGYKLTYLRYKE